jgi:hypothetical protein
MPGGAQTITPRPRVVAFSSVSRSVHGQKARVVFLLFTRASAHNFGAISIDLARDVAGEPFFIGLEECWTESSKIILAVRCH